ncbi:MAG: putative inorganic carbon transporter subunit DabA, partial [Verrucomicrobiota bacterium]
LDCGACGGHAGDANARVAAAILNQPAVRAGLKAQAIEIPAETIFIAGLHNTTTDEIVIYEDVKLSASQSAELEKIKGWLSAASKQARRERAASLGLGGIPNEKLDEKVFARSRDWSQVRPEWGLAGNAAFIAAPRERTRGLDLGGRAFLHNYRASLDPEKATLELILIAPMVVGSWINLQYYGSTVDNQLFGSGNKTIHNVVGTFGVWQGNGGDLQPGLPLQSLHDGKRWLHEPLRLSVFIEAKREDIAAILARQPGVRDLVQNGWVHLFAMENAGKQIFRFNGNRFADESL